MTNFHGILTNNSAWASEKKGCHVHQRNTSMWRLVLAFSGFVLQVVYVFRTMNGLTMNEMNSS